jgi:hypothetical protein
MNGLNLTFAAKCRSFAAKENRDEHRDLNFYYGNAFKNKADGRATEAEVKMQSCKIQLFLIAAAAASLIATPTFARTTHGGEISTSNKVFRSDGKVLGADPDVKVRLELMRDAYASEN